ncbi:MAG TPA: hypothetical protein VMO00_14030 [Methylomirabilota bacterium]|nr:hypothetical protein [Methylomirabilota bacterium]
MTTLSTKSAYVLSALVGAVSWIAVAQLTGRREAWDSEIYFSALLPGLWVCCAGLGFFAPVRPWRWGFVPFAAQAVAMIVQKPTGSLLPLGLILFAMLGAVAAVPALFGASLRRFAERRSRNNLS